MSRKSTTRAAGLTVSLALMGLGASANAADAVVSSSVESAFRAQVGASSITFNEEIVRDHGATRIAVTRAAIGGIPLRQALRRALVDGAGTVLVEVPAPPAGPWDGTPPTVTEAEALARVEASGLPGNKGARAARLVVETTANRTAPGWLIDPPYDPATATNARFLVDAISGHVRSLENRVSSVRVNAYAHNPVVDGGTYRPFELQTVVPGSPRIAGPRFVAVNCIADGNGWCKPAPLATPTNDAGDFLYNPPALEPGVQQSPLDSFAEGSAYFHAERFSQWLSEFGFVGLGCTQAGKRGTLVVNYRSIEGNEWIGFENARYTGDCDQLVLLGQTEDGDYAYDGDVIAHELGHGVVGAQMDGSFLSRRSVRAEAYVNDAGALNEAFADFFSSAYMGDPLLGEYVGQYIQGNTAIRNNDNDDTCPASFNGQLHNDSNAFAGALWDAHALYGRPIVSIALDSLALLRDDTSMEIASNTVINVTRQTLGNIAGDAVQDLFEDRGLTGCERIVGVDDVRPSLLVYPPGEIRPFAPPPLQVDVDVPPWAGTAIIHFSAHGTEDDSTDGVEPGLLIERDRAVRFSYFELPFSAIEVRYAASAGFADIPNGTVTVPTDGAAKLFLAFVNTGSARMEVDDIEVEFLAEDIATTGDDGTDSRSGTSGFGTETDGFETLELDDDSEKNGCLCRSSDRPNASWLLLLLTAGLFRRRK